MKRFLTVAAAMLALTGMGQVAMRKLEDLTNTNLVCVTDYGPPIVSLTQRVTGLEGNTNNWNTAYSWGNHAGLYREIGWVPSWTDVTDKPDLFDWSYDSLTDVPTTFPPEAHRHDYTAITNAPWLTEYTETDEIALAALYGTNTILEAAITNEAALRTAHTEDTGNPHDVTAAQIGAITVEQDLAALRTYHYGSPDIVESPAEWFQFDNGAGTITAFNWEAGRENVVIPWAIGGVQVTAIGDSAFMDYYSLTSVTIPNSVTFIGQSAFSGCESLTSLIIPNTVTSIGDYAFVFCDSLRSVTIPNSVTSISYMAFSTCDSLRYVTIPNSVTSIGNYAFYSCESLTSLYFDGNAPTIGAGIFSEITANQVTNYVTNPTATGWGEKLGGMPVVRPPLYADAIYQAGELVATTGHVAQAIAAIEFPVTSTNYTAWTGTVTPADGTATVAIAHGNMPVLVTDSPCVLTLDPTGYGTAGVSRVSLSYYTGTNSFTFATNIIDYAATPTVDTNGWNSLLIRRVSNGAWKGVGL